MKNHRKRADWSNAAMSWSYANLAGAILFIPFFIFLVSSSSTITFSAFLFSLLFILIGGALSIKSITLGAEAMKGEGGFFSRLFGLYGLITGVFAFIFAIFIFGILITLI